MFVYKRQFRLALILGIFLLVFIGVHDFDFIADAMLNTNGPEGASGGGPAGGGNSGPNGPNGNWPGPGPNDPPPGKGLEYYKSGGFKEGEYDTTSDGSWKFDKHTTTAEVSQKHVDIANQEEATNRVLHSNNVAIQSQQAAAIWPRVNHHTFLGGDGAPVVHVKHVGCLTDCGALNCEIHHQGCGHEGHYKSNAWVVSDPDPNTLSCKGCDIRTSVDHFRLLRDSLKKK